MTVLVAEDMMNGRKLGKQRKILVDGDQKIPLSVKAACSRCDCVGSKTFDFLDQAGVVAVELQVAGRQWHVTVSKSVDKEQESRLTAGNLGTIGFGVVAVGRACAMGKAVAAAVAQYPSVASICIYCAAVGNQ